jgi:hypothetical protein
MVPLASSAAPHLLSSSFQPQNQVPQARVAIVGNAAAPTNASAAIGPAATVLTPPALVAALIAAEAQSVATAQANGDDQSLGQALLPSSDAASAAFDVGTGSGPALLPPLASPTASTIQPGLDAITPLLDFTANT